MHQLRKFDVHPTFRILWAGKYILQNVYGRRLCKSGTLKNLFVQTEYRIRIQKDEFIEFPERNTLISNNNIYKMEGITRKLGKVQTEQRK